MQAALAHGVQQRRARRVAQRIGQPHAVADAHGAVFGGLQHTLGHVGLAGVQRHRQAGVAHPCQRGRVARRREAGFGPGQVEADHALAGVAQGQLGRAFDLAAELVAHAAQDQPAGQGAAGQAGEHGLHRGFGRHAVGLEQQRRDAELGQHRAVGQRVFSGLEGHAFQRGRAWPSRPP